MGGELLAAAAAPPAKLPSIPSTTLAIAADGITTTISSLTQEQLLEVFLRLPNLQALVRAALTCRSWLAAVRSSPSFRRRFRELHPAHLIGIFLDVDNDYGPAFAPVRRKDPDAAAALGGDFFLTYLPRKEDGASTGWTVTDCRDGYILPWNKFRAVAAAMTLAVGIIPLPDDVEAGSGLNFGFLGFHLLSSDDNPSSFRVVCVCKDQQRVRAAVFSPETSDWVVHPWMEIGGDNSHSLKYGASMLVDGSVYWPFHGEARMIRINTATMDVSSVDLPSQVQMNGCNCKAGETKDGELCIVYASDDFLNVWIRSVDSDGIAIWVRQNILSLSAEIDRITPGLHKDLEIVQIRSGYIPSSQGDLEILQVGSGYVYFSTTHITPAGTLYCWFSLSLETFEIELLIHGGFGGRGYPYVMAWPPCLVGDDGSTGHEVAGSHRSLQFVIRGNELKFVVAGGHRIRHQVHWGDLFLAKRMGTASRQ